ncbi:hypothetical protein [Actinoplanes sp. NPDC049681]|uniref:hypothetical protein n=1 Tax=Actinoplanes sp. NPDC049681 TaxID=3363905 RepID=UPI0037AD3F86
MTDVYADPYAPNGTHADAPSAARQAAGQSAQAAGQAASEVAGTAKHQAQRVAAEAGNQARTVAAELRDKVGEQARTQSDKLVSTIRETADHLDQMRGDRQDSPAATVVSRVADGGRQLADYLEHNGPEGVLREVTDFARRRPGAFLATALAAGFVVGRLGKGVMKADDSDSKAAGDAYNSGAASYGAGLSGTEPYGTTGYTPASTYGTGTTYGSSAQYGDTGYSTDLPGGIR